MSKRGVGVAVAEDFGTFPELYLQGEVYVSKPMASEEMSTSINPGTAMPDVTTDVIPTETNVPATTQTATTPEATAPANDKKKFLLLAAVGLGLFLMFSKK